MYTLSHILTLKIGDVFKTSPFTLFYIVFRVCANVSFFLSHNYHIVFADPLMQKQ